jgi:hypothetical protein
VVEATRDAVGIDIADRAVVPTKYLNKMAMDNSAAFGLHNKFLINLRHSLGATVWRHEWCYITIDARRGADAVYSITLTGRGSA